MRSDARWYRHVYGRALFCDGAQRRCQVARDSPDAHQQHWELVSRSHQTLSKVRSPRKAYCGQQFCIECDRTDYDGAESLRQLALLQTQLNLALPPRHGQGSTELAPVDVSSPRGRGTKSRRPSDGIHNKTNNTTMEIKAMHKYIYKYIHKYIYIYMYLYIYTCI